MWISAWVSELALCAALAACLVLALDWSDGSADKQQAADTECRSYHQMALCPDTGEVMLTGMPIQLRAQALADGRDVPGPAVPHGGATAIACSPADATRAVGYDDGSVWICGAEELGRCIRRADGQGAVRELAFAPDGGRLACGTDWGRIVILDLREEPRRPSHLPGDLNTPVIEATDCEAVMCLAFSPDGRTILAGGDDDGTIGLWDADSAKLSARLGDYAEHVTAAAFSPDGGRVYTASLDSRLTCWELASGRAVWDERSPRSIVSLALSPDGRRLACGTLSRRIELRNAATGAAERVLIGHPRGTSCLQFLAQSGRLVSAGYDGRVFVWDTAAWTPLRTF